MIELTCESLTACFVLSNPGRPPLYSHMCTFGAKLERHLSAGLYTRGLTKSVDFSHSYFPTSCQSGIKVVGVVNALVIARDQFLVLFNVLRQNFVFWAQ